MEAKRHTDCASKHTITCHDAGTDGKNMRKSGYPTVCRGLVGVLDILVRRLYAAILTCQSACEM